jgi:hypothetical protein
MVRDFMDTVYEFRVKINKQWGITKLMMVQTKFLIQIARLSAIYIFITKFVLKILIMTTAAIREKLYDYIRVADDKKVKAIYALLEDQIVVEKYDWSQDADFVAELDERVRRYEAGIDKGYSLEEVKTSLEELKKERAKSAAK